MNDQNIFNFEEVDAPQRSPHLIPWIVTGALAVIAILVSLIVMNIAKGDSNAAPDPAPPVTETPEPEPAPEPTPEPETEPEPEPEPEVDPARPDDAIDTSGVTVGTTFPMNVTQWGITTDVSTKISDISYRLEGNNLVISTSLVESLPASCAAQKTQWGLERVSDDEIRARSPQSLCEENESLYIELLGIVRHMEETVTKN